MSLSELSSAGYYIGLAVTSHEYGSLATVQVSNIQLTRPCYSETISQLQCDQASNCQSGDVSGQCYPLGEVPAWESAEAVNSIFDSGSFVSAFGCINSGSGLAPNYAVDGSTHKYFCERDVNEPTGLAISPSHLRPSIARGMRIYAHNNCPNCDPGKFLVS